MAGTEPPDTEPREVHRPFTLLDIMLLVAGCAVGFAAVAAGGPSGPGMGEVFSGVFGGALAGLHLIGPVVIWRGYRLTGRGVTCAGEWMWLFVWPMGLFLFLAALARDPSEWLFALFLAVLLIEAIVVAGRVAGAVMANGPRLHSQVGAGRSPVRRRRRADVRTWALGNIIGWVTLCWLASVEGGPVGPEAVWLAVAYGLLWAAVAAAVKRFGEPIGDRRYPWTHWFGLGLASLWPAFGLLVSLIRVVARAFQ